MPANARPRAPRADRRGAIRDRGPVPASRRRRDPRIRRLRKPCAAGIGQFALLLDAKVAAMDVRAEDVGVGIDSLIAAGLNYLDWPPHILRRLPHRQSDRWIRFRTAIFD